MALHLSERGIKIAARAGYSARGVVYAMIGLLIISDGVRNAGGADTKGAISALMEQPFGVFLVSFLCLGLCCYVGWRLIQVIFDPDNQGNSLKGLVIRGALLVSAITYTYLAIYALSLLTAAFSSGGGNDSGLRSFLNGLVGAQFAALALAIVFAGVAVAHWYKAFSGKYKEHFNAAPEKMRFIEPVTVVGLSARGVIFAVISWLLFSRFLYVSQEDASEKPGLQDALSYISQLPYGLWLLFGVGAGLLAFSLYSFAEARWRRIGDIT